MAEPRLAQAVTAGAIEAPAKFSDPHRTADGKRRAWVRLRALETLWFNTGTLCNLACAHCYIESSPKNDRLAYLSATDVGAFLDEIQEQNLDTRRIGFTGGEPFMNPQFLPMLSDALERGHNALVLTNGMRPMMKLTGPLKQTNQRFGDALEVRVSLDHYHRERHEAERGPKSWGPTIAGIRWLAQESFNVTVAGRTCWNEPEAQLRKGYAELFASLGIGINAADPARLVLFPEMDEQAEVPEISTECWEILGKSPREVMCSNSRMVIKRRGAPAPLVVACTLLAYQPEFELGATLKTAERVVSLNHRHCARFCVLGGGACST